MIILPLNEGRHCENLTETINMDTWLLPSLLAFEKTHSAHRQQPGHTLNWASLLLLGNFYGLGNFSGFCVKVHCKHLLSLCMIHIYKVSELSMENWAERVQAMKQQDAVSSPSHCCGFTSSAGVVWALSSSFTYETPEPELVCIPSWTMAGVMANKGLDRDLTSVYRHGVSFLGWNVWFSLVTSALWRETVEENFLPSLPLLSPPLFGEPGEWRESKKAVWGSGSELTLWVWQGPHFIPRPP